MTVDLGYALRSSVTDNVGLKLLSLLFAFVLYSFVHASHEAERTFTLNVIALTPPETSNRILVTQIPTVTAKIRGAASLLDDLHADDIGTLQLDLRGGNEARVTLQPSMIPVPPGLEVAQITPPAIDLQWEDRIVRDVAVQVGVVGAPAAGFIVKGAPLSDPQTVRARGPKSEVLVLQHARADAFDVTGLAEGKYSRPLAIERAPGRVSFDAQSVTATVDIAREVVERPFQKVPVAVLGKPQAKAQPIEVDVRLVCPPEVVRALRPEQIVPRVQIASAADHGSEAMPVQLSIDPCDVHVTPPTVIVRW